MNHAIMDTVFLLLVKDYIFNETSIRAISPVR